mmetsp:Transcript_14905/g.12684  ORF Transcript_14905/g.12684 Transcript_14905/m.12684 type:complete len:94 (-) Transcript_14905:2113-2394(-)
MARGFKLLIANYNLYADIYEKAEELRQNQHLRIQGTIFDIWKNDLKVVNMIDSQMKEKADLYRTKVKFDIWRQEFNKAQDLHRLEEKAESFYN